MMEKKISRIPNIEQNVRSSKRKSKSPNAEELKHNIEEILKNNDAERSSEIIAKKVSGFLQQQNANARKRRCTFLGLGIMLFLAFGVSWIIEYPLDQKVSGYWIIVIGAVGEILSAIFTVIMSNIMNKRESLCYRRKEQEGVFEAIFRMIREVKTDFPRMTCIHLLMCIFSVFLLGGIFAQFSLEHRVVEFCRNGSSAFLCYDSTSDRGMLANEETVIEETQLLEEPEPVQIERLSEDTEITAWEIKKEMRLAPDDWDLVFFRGEYDISGSKDQEQIDHVVSSMITELVSHDRENIFDKPSAQGGAPQSVMNDISNASAGEESAESFSEINRILDLRETVNEVYPKRSLTQLVANGYGKLAYLLYINNGNQTSMIYYYGQSIINNFKCLEFSENTDKTIKDRLKVIAQLYRNIAYVCPNSDEAGISLILAEAFEHAANQY